MREIVETADAPKAVGPYSQAVILGNMIFTSGQIYINPKTGKLLEGTIDEQVRQVMSNLDAILKAAGVDFGNVVKTTIYVTDMSLYGKVNEIYGKYFSETFPARETVCVKELPLGAKLEISMVAVRTSR